MKLNKLTSTLIASTIAIASSAATADTLRMGVVVKIGGIPWFTAMEEGIKSEAEKRGIDAWMIGPTAADPALQVRAIEDLIAQRVDVIGVVPNDPTVLEPVLKKAQEQGIKVIVHESPDQNFADWNFELADAKIYGETYAKELAQCMDGEGKYAIYVGGLTVPLHMAWSTATIDYLEANYPEMEMVADVFGVAESVDDSMRTTNDLFSKHPDMKGIIGFGSQGPIGAARVVQRQGKKDQACVLGPFSASQGQRLVNNGNLKGGFIWNPMTAGEVFVRVAEMTVSGDSFEDGMIIEGLGPIKISNNNLYGDKLEPLDKENIPRLVKLGL
ncbi:substrate-binding domain-containing protein [Photobacterium sp. BZF1]|uniref:substrate-binding domain-containing protein n=1 Tax=Photobacterium sp. BZF1 TaxID=1904457 RepID=UPI001653C126|nr:substrate-binding domain-containing protein [Photobacterium sp. BZF1]MBC7005582.1 substrate-binding domain-containing protein [Photobacterium sp. BZF1]